MKIIPLNEYPKPNIPKYGNTRAGIHGTAFADSPIGHNGERSLDTLVNSGFSWIKILSRENGNAEPVIDMALSRGMGVIVRMYRPEPNPGTLTPVQLATLDRWGNKYRGKPVYIQFNNEPDLVEEWRNRNKPGNWLDVVAQNAIADCEAIQQRGLIPVLPPAATHSPGSYHYRLIPKILELNGARIFDNRKIAFGVHCYTMGTPVGGSLYENNPFPYDSVNQHGRALALGEFQSYGDVWRAWDTDNPAIVNNARNALKKPGSDMMNYGGCASYLSWMYQYNININGILPDPIPVMELEGGEQVGIKFDPRYPRTSPQTRADRQRAIHSRLWDRNKEFSYPDWFFCTNSWLLDGDNSEWPNDGWFSNGEPRLPEYRTFFDWHKVNAKDCSSLYVRGNDMIGFDGAIIRKVGNFNQRPNNTLIDSMVIHATAGVPGRYGNSDAIVAACLSWWNNPASQASAHYIITKDGRIFQCVSEHLRAWHAGESSWNNPQRTNFNNFSIGIELTNENDGIDPYPQTQIDALVELSKDIVKRYPAMRRNLYLGHRHISGYRGKTDPANLNLEPLRILIFDNREVPVIPIPIIRISPPIEEMTKLAQERQLIRLNPSAAIQSYVVQDNLESQRMFVVTSPEIETTGTDGTTWVFQRYEDLQTGTRRIYYTIKGDWGNIQKLDF